jgi:hypothetical protein
MGADSPQQGDDAITGAEITGSESQQTGEETQGAGMTQQGAGVTQQVVSTTQVLAFDRFKNRSRPRPAHAGLNVIKTVSVATVVQRTQNRKLFDMEPSPPVSRAQSKSVK